MDREKHNKMYDEYWTMMEKGFISPKQLVWIKKHADCKHLHQNDFSYYKDFDSFEKIPHFYCITCCTRWHKGKENNPKEWEDYING